MIECALYGVMKEKFEWSSENFNREEKVYSNNKERIFVYSRYDEAAGDAFGARAARGVHEIVRREAPDRNKQKTTVLTKLHRARLGAAESPDRLVASLGYRLVSMNHEEVHCYRRNGYTIELARYLRTGDALPAGLPEELYEYFLVKVFVEVEDAQEGEQAINGAFRDLEGRVKLIKPPLAWF